MAFSSSSMYHGSSTAIASSAKLTCVGELHLLSVNSETLENCTLVVISSSDAIQTNGSSLIVAKPHKLTWPSQWVFDDFHLSAKHVRVYTIVYNDDEKDRTEYLVYLEDVSRNGTFWNGALVGKGNGGVLLSHNDSIRLSSKTHFRFCVPKLQLPHDYFDLEQEREMARFRQEYVITDRLLGSGAFGQVFMAIEQRTRTQVACKVVDLRKLTETTSKHFENCEMPAPARNFNQTAQTQNIKAWVESHKKSSQLDERLKSCFLEVEILSGLRHPNIIRLDKVYITDNTMSYMFEDLITAGDLFSYLESKNGKLLEVEAAVVVRQILIAVQYLHEQNIVHRDLKPENVMMTSLSASCRIVLTDFGAAKRLTAHQRMTSLVGSDAYAAPEIKTILKSGLVHRGYTKAVDMWSIGAITVVLLTGGSAFSDSATGLYSPVLARNCDLASLNRSKEWQVIRARPKDFVARLLIAQEQERMTVEQALQHDWFSNEMHKTDFEALYLRTVKNWRSRTTRSPVVEFVQSTYVRFLEVSQICSTSSKRHRQANKPVEPAYKLFPRNMHIPLWPARKMAGHIMSDEVKTAIAEVWTGQPTTSVSRFKTFAPFSKTNLGGDKNKNEEMLVDSTDKAIINVQDARQKLSPTTALPLRLLSQPLPTLDPIVDVPRSATPIDEGLSTARNKVQYLNKNSVLKQRSIPTGSRQVRSSKDGAPNLSRGLSVNLNFRSNDDIKKKRWRDSMFNVGDGSNGTSGDANNVDAKQETAKRRRLTSTSASDLRGQENDIVLAHDPHEELELDTVEQNSGS